MEPMGEPAKRADGVAREMWVAEADQAYWVPPLEACVLLHQPCIRWQRSLMTRCSGTVKYSRKAPSQPLRSYVPGDLLGSNSPEMWRASGRTSPRLRSQDNLSSQWLLLAI